MDTSSCYLPERGRGREGERAREREGGRETWTREHRWTLPPVIFPQVAEQVLGATNTSQDHTPLATGNQALVRAYNMSIWLYSGAYEQPRMRECCQALLSSASAWG